MVEAVRVPLVSMSVSVPPSDTLLLPMVTLELASFALVTAELAILAVVTAELAIVPLMAVVPLPVTSPLSVIVGIFTLPSVLITASSFSLTSEFINSCVLFCVLSTTCAASASFPSCVTASSSPPIFIFSAISEFVLSDRRVAPPIKVSLFLGHYKCHCAGLVRVGTLVYLVARLAACVGCVQREVEAA